MREGREEYKGNSAVFTVCQSLFTLLAFLSCKHFYNALFQVADTLWLRQSNCGRIREDDLMHWFVRSAELLAGCSAAAFLARWSDTYSDASVLHFVAKGLVLSRHLAGLCSKECCIP